jgi:hypothetical protein
VVGTVAYDDRELAARITDPRVRGVHCRRSQQRGVVDLDDLDGHSIDPAVAFVEVGRSSVDLG